MVVPEPKSNSRRRVGRSIGSDPVDPKQSVRSFRLDEMKLRIDSKHASGMDLQIDSEIDSEIDSNRSDWLVLHATDLIDRLTEWSDDLSVREANLNAREATWERQARRLRMQFQELSGSSINSPPV